MPIFSFGKVSPFWIHVWYSFWFFSIYRPLEIPPYSSLTGIRLSFMAHETECFFSLVKSITQFLYHSWQLLYYLDTWRKYKPNSSFLVFCLETWVPKFPDIIYLSYMLFTHVCGLSKLNYLFIKCYVTLEVQYKCEVHTLKFHKEH